MHKYPEYTAQQIAQELNKTPRTVKKYLAKLKDAGIIIRKGPKLGGYWEII
ncbi:MAG: HTH domain-containing protein [Candidatus Kapabacteria bacterium]|nr:HTH domain-containing protein [Candidatus Kapabacteria bacterium]